MIEWYEEEGTPDPAIWWWAILHQGHPAFYLRALMPGDFAPGHRPLARHAVTLDGSRPEEPLVCGTCELAPEPEDLEPIERATGNGGFLDEFRRGRTPWRTPTDPASCWLCSTKRLAANVPVTLESGDAVMMCAGCAAHQPRGRY